MPEVPDHVLSPASAPEVSPPAAMSAKEQNRLPMVEIIRERLLTRPGARQIMRYALDQSVEQATPGHVPERRGKITGRTHDQVVEDTLDVQQRRLRRRRRVSNAIGHQAL